MSKKKSNRHKDSHFIGGSNEDFAGVYYHIMREHTPLKDLREVVIKLMGRCFDAYPQARAEAEKHYIEILETHNEG